MSAASSEDLRSRSQDSGLGCSDLESNAHHLTMSAPGSSASSPRGALPKVCFLDCDEVSDHSPRQKPFFFSSMVLPDSLGKYKTELCNNYTLYGSCKFEKTCCFAHGPHELRSKELSASFKSKFCRKFNSHAFCNYGSRCQYIHSFSYQSALQNLVDKSLTMIANFPKVSLMVLLGQIKIATKPLAIFQRFQRIN